MHQMSETSYVEQSQVSLHPFLKLQAKHISAVLAQGSAIVHGLCIPKVTSRVDLPIFDRESSGDVHVDRKGRE